MRPVARAVARRRRADGAGERGTRGGMWLMLREAWKTRASTRRTGRSTTRTACGRSACGARGSRRSCPCSRGEQPLVVDASPGERHRDGAAPRRRVQAQARPGRRERGMDDRRRDRAARRCPSSSILSRICRRASTDSTRAPTTRRSCARGRAFPSCSRRSRSHQPRLLWQHAGNAVRLGMDHDAAIRAVTEAPAEAFGLKGYGRHRAGRGRQRRRLERRPAADRARASSTCSFAAASNRSRRGRRCCSSRYRMLPLRARRLALHRARPSLDVRYRGHSIRCTEDVVGDAFHDEERSDGHSARRHRPRLHPGLDRRVRSIFTSGSASRGASCSRTRRISRPVCTTELGVVAKLKPEFEKRNVKVIAVSVDDVASHKKWAGDIEETQKSEAQLSRSSVTRTARWPTSTG